MASALQLAGAQVASTGDATGTSTFILESIIPGFSIMRQLFLQYFRYDITSLVTRAIFFAMATQAGRYLEEGIKDLLLRFCCASVTISPNDRLYREVTSWMAVHVIEKGALHMAAKSSKNDDTANDPYRKYNALYGATQIYAYNPSDFDENTPPVTYSPSIGTQWFWYGFRPFMYAQYGSGRNGMFYGKDCGDIVIYSLGRTTAPLKRFIQECKDFEEKTRNALTTIHIKSGARSGSIWSDPILKPDRPLDTIDMDETLKNALIEDFHGYLHPTARRSYGRRGIPYRRGYLFYGPPGTGKTSMCFALAGHFKLELYTLSGQGLQDYELDQLFTALPPKCIVLLEDIDSAGITREHNNESMPETEQPQNQNSRMNLTRVTLSGLLNAIDGTTSQEGRVLIMTTNTPEKLDKALIRPGRIDQMVYFGPVTKKNAESIFMRMFSRDRNGDEEHAIWLVDTKLSEKDLREMAVEFSKKFPEGQITPAEVQGFLVNTKSPHKALAEVEGWIAKTLESRDGSKAFEKMEIKTGEPSEPSKDSTKAEASSSGLKIGTVGKAKEAAVESTESSPKKTGLEGSGAVSQGFLPTWEAYKMRASEGTPSVATDPLTEEDDTTAGAESVTESLHTLKSL
ncbi:P-loop containing nucleoside triphosphate hydrolase protein [Mytilinidion resinicola]|uniref:P-loop containing nucleoside triphosphate hydrolase protein n=1 Tax=Mytilinidion resinicola TaxID=574789 RepID=A0A6A6Z8N5_9PEZI|nr:P-loop containing nucleoside triphosphate hydrolase protein [Mytilinidion resinicola]KAF2817069.1 P-loop containing nucleoside triphosphate hydrolase protein [Mytilinidion resinicola]